MPRISTTKAFAFDDATVSNTALSLVDIGFTQAQVDRASRVRLTCATQPIRYRYDGGAPTAALGHYLAVDGQIFIEDNLNIQHLRVIRATGVDGAVSVTLEE